MKPTCPKCHSTDVTFRNKKQCYICEDCNTEFILEHEFKALRIFISYGHDEHVAFAQNLAEEIKAKGHEVWFDLNRIKPGGDWERYIEEGLSWAAEKPGIGRIILIMTPHSVRRPDGYCLNEIARALDHHLLILPVMLVWCSPPLSICRLQWLDMQHCATSSIAEGRYIATKNRLLDALETQSFNFEGQTSLLRNNLNPLSFEADVIHYQKWFTGREWVFDRIDEWLQTSSASRLFWITGLPGIGKTAIATKLIQRLENLVAFHLCRRGNSEKASPRRAVMSISYQLSTQFPDYAEKLTGLNLSQLLSDPTVNAAALFDALIVQPLATDIQRPDSLRIILIDGLDEATSNGRNLLAEFIASEFKKLPDWLRIIITSRPDPEVTVPLQEWERWTLETNDPKNQRDLGLYINSMLLDYAPNSISDEVLSSIIQNSEGIFLYAEWVCREIKEGGLSLFSPQDFPKGLGGIYDDYFKKKLIQKDKYLEDIELYQQKIRPVFELVIAAREPLPLMQISKWLNWNRYEKESFFKKLGSLFFLDSSECIRPFHTSLLDWLGDSSRAGDFFVNVVEGNQNLTNHLWDQYSQIGAISVSLYTLRYLPAHLMQEKRWDDLVNLLCNLDFIQAKAAAKMTYELVDDMNEALFVIPDNQENIQKENDRQARLDKYSNDLILYANGKTSVLDVPESFMPWYEDQMRMEIERMRINPNKADKLKDFCNFLGQEASNLQNYAHEFPHFATQQAWNYSSDGPVGKAAEDADTCIYKNLLCRIPASRPPWNPIPQIFQSLKDHSNSVMAVSITPDGKWAVSGSKDNTCILWNLATGEALRILKGHNNWVMAVSITPDGKWAISGSKDKTCILWNLKTGEIYKTLKGHTNCVMAVSITPNGERAISGSKDNNCILWNLKTGKPIKTLKKHTYYVNTVAITADGQQAISGSCDKKCILWDLKTGKPIHILRGHTYWVNSVAITPDGQRAISGSEDTTCILWDLTIGEAIHTLKGHVDSIWSVSITPDGKRAISGSWDKTCILWNLISGTAIKTLNGHSDSVWAVSITSDGKRAISGSNDNTCIYWNLTAGTALKTINGHTDSIRDVSVTPDGKRAISSSKDMTCILWNLTTGEALQTFEGHTSSVWNVSITPDGKRAITSSKDNTSILWNLSTGEALQTINKPTFVLPISITPDGKRAISGSWEKACILRNIITGKVLYTLEGHLSFVYTISISPDGKRAITGSEDKTCILWDLTTGESLQILKGHTDYVLTVSISADGKMAFSGSNDKTCILWDLTSGKQLARFVTRSAVNASEFFSGGIFLGCDSGEVIILNSITELMCQGCGIVTIRKIWDYELQQYQPPSADCPFCGNRFTPPKTVLTTIKEISKNIGLKPEQSPCLELPEQIWEEPRLLDNCPKCGKELKFNPFIV